MTPRDPEDLPLRDIHLPDAVAWWPPAPGWWLLPVLLTAAGLALWWWQRTRGRRLLRRAALAELSRIEQALPVSDDRHACASALSRLCRRLLLAAGEQHAAARTDDGVIAVLEESLGVELPAAQRSVLLTAPYSPRAAQSISRDNYQGLISALRSAVSTFTPPRNRTARDV